MAGHFKFIFGFKLMKGSFHKRHDFLKDFLNPLGSLRLVSERTGLAPFYCGFVQLAWLFGGS